MNTSIINKLVLTPVVFGLIFSFLGIPNVKASGTEPKNPLQKKGNELGLSQPVDQKSLIAPQLNQSEYIMEAIAQSINRVNLSQEDGAFDETDMNEDFTHFSYTKYQEVLQGKRKYRYLQFHTFWDDSSKNVPHIRVLVNIPDSENGINDAQYFEEILQVLENQYHIDTSHLDKEQKAQIIRDIADGNRFTCVKSLRFVWALFAQSASPKDHPFPQIFKLNISKAGELVNFVNNGSYLFSTPNMLQPVQLSNTIATNVEPSARPTLFEGKMVVYFRPILNSIDTGHVGIGWVTSKNSQGAETISFFEVNGETGMAHYHQNVSLYQFKMHLYNILPPVQSQKALIGWFINS